MTTAKLFDFSAAHQRRSSRMENQKQGHFALFRSLLSKEWAKDTAKLAMWVRLIGEAAYKPRTVEFSGKQWHLQPGELVTTAAILARKLRDQDGKEKSPQAVTRMINFFAREGMITTKGTRFGTVICITNYGEYQVVLPDEPRDKPSDNNKPSAGAALNHVPDEPRDKPSGEQNKKGINKNKDIPTLTRPEGGDDDSSLKENLIALLQGQLNFDNAKDLHNAVEAEVLKAGYFCQREFVVADRGDGRKGKVDLYVSDMSGASCGIEIDWKSPREKSIIKLQQLPTGFVLLRESGLAERYEVAGITVVNANNGEVDKTPAGYYQSFLDAYNEITNGALPQANDLNPERKRKIKALVNQLATPNIDGYRAYVRAFMEMAKPFYFGDNDRGWVADFDYLLRPNVLTKIREGNL